jgi:hypothetical protein
MDLLRRDTLRYNKMFTELLLPEFNNISLTIGCHIIHLRGINTIDQSFDCRLMLIFMWKVNKSYELINVSKNSPEWKPSFMFLNNKIVPHKINETFNKIRKKTYTNMVYKVIYDGTFVEHFELQHFPIDTQRLYIRTILTDFPVSIIRNDREIEMSNKFTLLKIKPLIYEEGFSESNTWELIDGIHMDEGRTLANRNDGIRYSTVNIYVTISRNVGFYIWNAMIPVTILVTCSFLSFILNINELASSSQITLTMMLTLIALKFSLVQYIQTTSYMTYMDKYILIAFIYIGLVIVQNVVMYYLSNLYSIQDIRWNVVIKANNISAISMCVTWIFFNLLILIIMSISKLRRMISFPIKDASFNSIDLDNLSLDSYNNETSDRFSSNYVIPEHVIITTSN